MKTTHNKKNKIYTDKVSNQLLNGYNKHNLNWFYKNDTWIDLNSGIKLTRKQQEVA